MPQVLTEYAMEQMEIDLTIGAGIDPSTLPNVGVWYEPAKQGLSDGAPITSMTDNSGAGNTGAVTGTLHYRAATKAADFGAGSVSVLSPAFFTSAYDSAFTSIILPTGNNSGLTVHHAIGSSYFGDRNTGQWGYALGSIAASSFLVPTTQQKCVEIVRWDGTTLTFFSNGFAYVHTASSGVLGANGHALTLGQVGGSFQWLGLIQAVILGHAAWTDAQCRGIAAYLGMPQAKQVICDGNSLTVGAGGLNGWPIYAFDALGVGTGGYDVATTGINLPSLISRYSGLVPPLFAPALDNIVTVQEIVNTLADDTVSAATCEGYLATYAAAVRASGAKVIVATALPASSSGIVNPSSYETKRQAVNTWIRGPGASNFDAIADVGSNVNIGQAGDPTNPVYYQSDQIHLTNLGQQIQAGYWQTAIASV
jgi:hypothetical protein